MATTMVAAEGMSRVPTYSPTASTSQAVFYPHSDQSFMHPSSQFTHMPPHPIQYAHPQQPPHQFQQMRYQNAPLQPQYVEYIEAPPPNGIHEMAQGRMALPMHAGPSMTLRRRTNQSPNPAMMDRVPSPYIQMEDGTPTMITQSPSVLMPVGLPQVSPTEELRQQIELQPSHTMQMLEAPQMHIQMQMTSTQPHPQLRRPVSHQGRPPMVQRHSMQVTQATSGVPARPTVLQRHQSLHAPMHRSASPQIVQGDVFDSGPSLGSPPRRPSSSLGLVEELEQPHPFPVQQNMFYFQTNPGISPARALGPQPSQTQFFSPNHADPMITPHAPKSGYMPEVHSSGATASTATSSSSLTSASDGSQSVERRPMLASSDDEEDSPTKGPILRVKIDPETTPVPTTRSMAALPINRPDRPIVKPTVIGGRTSAKFAKVAEDPGVEGVPPGPRPMERPSPSFACIIGQAILRCKAGGLSLEHIYRYVETAYPFFKSGDGAWRNSVRHNLSIHKMFETIPRTEKFPPGKGGIWIIHEEEKCHWPSEDKFIKNFPASHHHHATCRQTIHERQKEREAIDKAAREGKVYVPKKGKKGRKLAARDDDEDGDEAVMEDGQSQPSVINALPPAPVYGPPIITPQMQTKILHPSIFPPLMPMDAEDDGDFLPLQPEGQTPTKDFFDPLFFRDDTSSGRSIMVPPQLQFKERHRDRHRPVEDEENVFTSSIKRVRVAEPLPLQPIGLDGQSYLDDSFITPERERPGPGSGPGSNPTSSSSLKLHSSAFKTPALVNTSSSPGSSPMPTTVPRTAHHPSALQQAWTHDDMAETASNTSSPRPMLDAAFDLKPKMPRTSRIHQEEDFMSSMIAMSATNAHANANAHLAIPPKTPVSRSSAGGGGMMNHKRDLKVQVDMDAATAAGNDNDTTGSQQQKLITTPQKDRSQKSTDQSNPNENANQNKESDANNPHCTPRLPLRTPHFAKTPMMFPGSPARAPPTVSALLSTPAWEMSGCLDRLGDPEDLGYNNGVMASPTHKVRPGRGYTLSMGMGMGSGHERHRSFGGHARALSLNGVQGINTPSATATGLGGGAPRSPGGMMPPTSPTRYSILLGSGSGGGTNTGTNTNANASTSTTATTISGLGGEKTEVTSPLKRKEMC